MTFFRPFDLALLCVVLLAASVAYSLMEEKPGAIAEVYVSNKKTAVFNLDGPLRQKEIATRIGKIKIQYGEGAVQVLHSPCDQKICMLQGAIRHTYEQIVCLPAQMRIILINHAASSQDKDGVDAISH